MASALGSIVFVGCGVCALIALVLLFVRRSLTPEAGVDWPVCEGTIQSVGQVAISAGRGGSYTIDVADFSYRVNDEYFSGRVKISGSSSANDLSPKSLIGQKIQVRYSPENPEKYSVHRRLLDGFSLARYDESSGQDIGLIDLNIDKG